MSTEIVSDELGTRLARSASNNATASLPSPQEAALQELWLRVFDMTAELSSDGALTPPSDPLALPQRSSSPQAARQPRSYIRPVNAPPTPGHSRNRKKRKDNDDHWHVDPAELHEGIYNAMRCNTPDWWINHYLRANDFDVNGALDDLLRHVHWRRYIINMDDDVLPNGEAGALRTKRDPKADPKAKRVAEGFLNIFENEVCRILKGRDHRGRIIGMINVRRHRRGEYPKESYERYISWHVEIARLIMKGQTGNGIVIFDLHDYKIPNMDFRPIKSIIHIMKDMYPQGLGDVILHRAPPLVMPVWALVKPLVKEEYHSHIHFTKDITDLERHVPYDSIPKELGGGDDTGFPYEYPDLDDPVNGGGSLEVQKKRDYERNLLQEEHKELVRLFEETTKEWINAARTGRDGRGLKILREKYSQELSKSYWRLDPYTRARTIYDRWGWI